MAEKENGHDRQQKHEAMYRRTVRSALEGIDNGAYSEAAAPRILEQLRAELGQCIELLLISSEFYSEQMEIIGKRMAAEV